MKSIKDIEVNSFLNKDHDIIIYENGCKNTLFKVGNLIKEKIKELENKNKSKVFKTPGFYEMQKTPEFMGGYLKGCVDGKIEILKELLGEKK